VTIGARFPGRPPRGPQRLGVLGQDDRRVVGRIEVVAEANGLGACERIAVAVLLGRHRPLERLEVGDDVDDLLGAEEAGRAPRRHHRVREERASVPDDLIQVFIRQAPIADRRLVGTCAPSRPDVVTRHQVTGDTRPLAAVQEQSASFGGITDDTSRHRHALHRRLGSLILVRVRRGAIEIARRPAGIANGNALAVGLGAQFASRFGQRARGPLRDAPVVGHVERRPGAAGARHHERHPAQPSTRRRVYHVMVKR